MEASSIPDDGGAAQGARRHGADLELVRHVLDGRDAALEEFVQRMRCIPRVLAVRNRAMGSPLQDDDLADLAQETFLTLWRKLDTYRGTARLETWVTRFCLFGYMNALRRRGRSPRSLEPAALTDTEPEASRLQEGSALDALQRALARLDDRTAEVITLRDLDQLSFPDIASASGEPLGTVKNRYYRGLQKLRGLLAADEREGRL